VIDDLIVYQINPESYMLVVNASHIAKDHAWVLEHNNFDCTVNNRSDEFSLVAVQGPQTNRILEAFGLKHIASQAAFTFKQLKVDGHKVIVAGTGYTGERGFELIVPNEDAVWLWDRLMEVGAPLGAVPVGLGARDTLRLEMAYSLYGHELADDISVLEANLAWTVRFGPGFLGKDYLLKQKEDGLKRIIAGLVAEDRAGSPRNGAPVYNSAGETIGHVTSGSHSPSLDKAIALALVAVGESGIGNTLQVDIRGKKLPARVCETPFYSRKK
jgi:aminomethyltransferase